MADMDGAKFRAADTNTSRLAGLMGATPTKTEATEISQAFSTGVADSMMGSGAIDVFQKMWDNADYFYTVNGWMPKSAVIVNLDAWNDLDPATQAVVLEAAAKAEAAVWQAARGITESYNATMAENGMSVAALSETLAKEFRGSARSWPPSGLRTPAKPAPRPWKATERAPTKGKAACSGPARPWRRSYEASAVSAAGWLRSRCSL